MKNVKVMDSPGIVALPSNPAASMALRSLQVEEGKETVLEAVRTLLKQCDKTQVRAEHDKNNGEFERGVLMCVSVLQVMLQYNVPDYRNSLEFLTLFAKKRGFLQKGGVANTEQAAMAFLADWTG